MQVHGHTTLSTVAIQVPLRASSLNTNDCFVLVTKEKTLVWMGKGATNDEQKVAKNVVAETNNSNSLEAVMEGQENNEFWGLLGGKGSYIDEVVCGKKEMSSNVMPRLFQGSNASGSFTGKNTRLNLTVGFVIIKTYRE